MRKSSYHCYLHRPCKLRQWWSSFLWTFFLWGPKLSDRLKLWSQRSSGQWYRFALCTVLTCLEQFVFWEVPVNTSSQSGLGHGVTGCVASRDLAALRCSSLGDWKVRFKGLDWKALRSWLSGEELIKDIELLDELEKGQCQNEVYYRSVQDLHRCWARKYTPSTWPANEIWARSGSSWISRT